MVSIECCNHVVLFVFKGIEKGIDAAIVSLQCFCQCDFCWNIFWFYMRTSHPPSGQGIVLNLFLSSKCADHETSNAAKVSKGLHVRIARNISEN